MTFREVLAYVIDWLQQDKRVSYRALKREFDIDDDYLEDLKDALCFSYPVVDEEGRGLVWTGEPISPEPHARHSVKSESRFHALLPEVMARLQRDGRVTYRTLKSGYPDEWAPCLPRNYTCRAIV